MKPLPFFLRLSVMLLLVQCKDNTKSVVKQAAEMPGGDQVNINITVDDFSNNTAVAQANVETVLNGDTISSETTNPNGGCALNNVTPDKQYIFGKSGYQTQQLEFGNIGIMSGMNVFLKQASSLPNGPICLRGYVHQIHANQQDTTPWAGLTVFSGTVTRSTDKDGFYNLPVSAASAYSLVFQSQSQTITQLTVKPQQDTSRLDLYLNSLDSLIIDRR